MRSVILGAILIIIGLLLLIVPVKACIEDHSFVWPGDACHVFALGGLGILCLVVARKKLKENAPSIDFDKTESDVEAVLKLDLSTDSARAKHRRKVIRMIQRLDAIIEKVRKHAKGYPGVPISMDVWFSGANYAGLSRELTHHFKEAGWLEREENASALWAKATLAVCAHYPHMVGTAMLANADCQDRLGNSERSTQMYSSVVKDFVYLLGEWENETESPTDEDRLALESLLTAAERLMARGTVEVDSTNLSQLQSGLKNVLSRPIEDK